MDEILQIVYSELKDIYDDCDISEEDLREFAEELTEQVFSEECPLNDVLGLVYCFEEQMRDDGVIIEVGRQCAVYDVLLDHLDQNEKNAKRLYESFLFYRDVNAFCFLMDDFDDWLTKEELDEVLAIGEETFIESVRECYT